MIRKPQFYIPWLSKGNLICGMRVLPVLLRIFSAFGPYPDYRRLGYIEATNYGRKCESTKKRVTYPLSRSGADYNP